MCTEIPMWQGIIALQIERFYLLGKGGFRTTFTPEEGWNVAFSLEICHGDVNYSRNIDENLIALSFVALNRAVFTTARTSGKIFLTYW